MDIVISDDVPEQYERQVYRLFEKIFACWWASSSTHAPTISAWIGNSRPDRSTATASLMEAGRPKEKNLIESGANGSTCVQHIVHQDNIAIFNRLGQIGGFLPRG